MRNYLFALVFVAGAAHAQAGPHLYSNVADGTDICIYTPQGGSPIEVPVIPRPASPPPGITSTNICKIDLAASPVGLNNVTLAAKSTLWGLTSSATPFSFARPSAPVAPSGLRLAP